MAGEVEPLAVPSSLGPPLCEPWNEEASKTAFRAKYGKDIVEPVLGHYLYRLAAPTVEPLPPDIQPLEEVAIPKLVSTPPVLPPQKRRPPVMPDMDDIAVQKKQRAKMAKAMVESSCL